MTPHDERVLLNLDPANTSLAIFDSRDGLLRFADGGPSWSAVLFTDAVLAALPVVREAVRR